jgi:hypothetical protein
MVVSIPVLLSILIRLCYFMQHELTDEEILNNVIPYDEEPKEVKTPKGLESFQTQFDGFD